MVSIANVGGTDTFGTWITKSNQSFNELTLLTGVTGTTSTKSITGIANNLTVTGDSLFSGVHNLSNTTVTLPVVGNLTIPGGSSGYQLTTDGAGTISWAIPGGSTPSFATTTGVIANTQFPGTLGLSSNTYFTGANNTFASASVTLGAVGNVHITGGTTGFPLKTDGSGTLSWGTLGNTAIAAGAVGNTEIATAAVTNTHIKDAAVGPAEIAAALDLSGHTVTLASTFGKTDATQNWTKGQRGEITALADGATITPDFDDSNNFSVTLGGNRAMMNPTNQTAGQTGSIFVTQDATGSRTLAYGGDWQWAANTAPTLTTTPAAVDRIDYMVRAANSIHAIGTLAYSL